MTEKNDSRVNRGETLGAVDATGQTEDDGSSRRTILKGVVASAAATVGLTNVAAALDPESSVALHRAKRPYTSATAKRQAIETHGGNLFDLLAEHGYIESPDELAEFTTGAWTVGGTPTARIESLQEYGDGQLRVAIEPQTGRQYAVDTSGDSWTILDPDAGVKQACNPRITMCLPVAESSCSWTSCEKTEVCCQDGGCYPGISFKKCCNCETGCRC